MSGCDHPVDPGDRFCRVCGTPVAHDVTSVGIAGPGSSGSLPAVGSGVAPDLGPGEAVLDVGRGPGGSRAPRPVLGVWAQAGLATWTRAARTTRSPSR